MTPALLLDLGRRGYEETLALQREMVAERQAGARKDTLILVEHDEVITLGRRQSARANVLTDAIRVVEVERGGDVTWHGPGQLVAYPILALDGAERDLHRFLRAIEEGVIDLCRAFGLDAGRKAGWTGAWLGERKVASIGIAVRRWVSFHGVAINVCSDLARFRAIHPCGLDASVMTSLTEALGRPIAVDEVKPGLAAALGRALGRSFVPDPA